MVIESKKWDPSKIRINLDTRMMGDLIKQTHIPIPTSDQLRHKFAGSNLFLILDFNHAFHQMGIDEESSRMCVFATPLDCFNLKGWLNTMKP